MSWLNQRLNTPFMGSEEIGNPDDRLNKQNTLVLSGEVGLSERVSLQALLPLRTFDISGRQDFEASGMGDLDLAARISLTDAEQAGRFSAVALTGASLPTGKDSDAEVLAENSQFSRGVVSAILGGQLNTRLGSIIQLFGQAATWMPIGDDDGYTFGASRFAAVNVSAPFASSRVSWLAGLSFRYAARDSIDIEDDGRGSITVPNRGGHQTRALGGVMVKLSDDQSLGFQANYLLDANLHGDQLTARMEFILGWQMSAGSHAHAEH